KRERGRQWVGGECGDLRYPPIASRAKESGQSRSPHKSRMTSSSLSLMIVSTRMPAGSAKNLVFKSSTNDFSSVRVVVFINHILAERNKSKDRWGLINFGILES